MAKRISAVFDSRTHAEQAIRDLRDLGIEDRHLSVIARHHDERSGGGGGGSVAEAPTREVTGEGAGKGLAAGAGLGALFGLATAFIPGIGPFLAAGTLAATLGTVGASTVAGAALGGVTGALAGALAKMGYTEEESKFYGPEIERGGYLITLELPDTGLNMEDRVREIIRKHGGRSAGRAV